MMPLLEIDNLQGGFDTEAGLLRAVDGVSMSVAAGQTLGLVGESGCGKSVTAASVLRLVPSPPGVMLGGAIRFDGQDILKLPRDALQQLRGREIAMVFQDPMTSLNPVFTIERQLWEVLSLRFGLDRAAARQRAAEMLRTVGIADPEARLAVYPHELSGGMKQRVMIAMALLCEPRLLIADGAGADPAPDARVAAQDRHRAALHHPRHGRHCRDVRCRGRDVCRTRGGTAAGGGTLRSAAPPLYARPARQHSAQGRGAQGRAAHHRRHRAFAAAPAAGVPFCRPLPASRGPGRRVPAPLPRACHFPLAAAVGGGT